MDNNQKDLDVFLASIESKLRGPFSSLDLAKAIATTHLRDNLSPREYLNRISQVILKADKITQCRIVIALLGLDPSTSSSDNDNNEETNTDKDIFRLLQQTQEAPLYEEWVRICSALVQGIMFEDGRASTGEVAGMMGEQASKLLEMTTSEVIKRVQAIERATEYEEDDKIFVPSRLDKADADPTMAPYRYALLNQSLLQRVIPETRMNYHFTVNESVEILALDACLEKAKAEEEKEHDAKIGVGKSTNNLRTSNSTISADSSASASQKTAVMPGYRPNNNNNNNNSTTTANNNSNTKKPALSAQRPKASMFMPAKKPAQGLLGKTALHARKAGAAQALLSKGRTGGTATTTTAGTTTTANNNAGASATASSLGSRGIRGVVRGAGRVVGASASPSRPTTMAGRGRAAALLGSKRNTGGRAAAGATAHVKSKMMRIDVAEVQNLSQQREQQQQLLTSGGNKRKAAAAEGLDSHHRPNKSNKKFQEETVVEESSMMSASSSAAKPAQAAAAAAAETDAEALASAALSAYQAQMAEAAAAVAVAAQQQQERTSSSSSSSGLDWREMLKRSNRLTEDDRNRIQLFFVNKFNPTPDQPLYRMKLHEERVVDPKTGGQVKQTYYLDLDYSSFTSRQSKKTKRYKEGHG